MLVYEVGMWKSDGNRFLLTNSHYTIEGAWNEFNQRYNVFEEIDALPLLIS